MPTVNPLTIILARESRGLTQTDLAQRMGVSQALLSKIENAQAEPSPETLGLLGSALAYPVTFFSRRIEHRNLPLPFYRKRKLTISLTRQIGANLSILRDHVGTLVRSVDLPANKVPQVDLKSSGKSPTSVAQELRILWHVPPGPIENVTRLLEKNGVVVMRAEFGTTKVDAVSLYALGDNLPPMIFINPSAPGDRLRFTLLHELAHMIFHHHLSMPPDDTETVADEFASEFLLPGREIRPFLSALTLQRLAQLKVHWGASMQALIMRAASLNRITDRQKRTWFTRLSQLGYRREEPIEVVREEPTLVRQIMDVHLKDLGYSETQLCSALDMLPEKFREQYMGRRTLSLVS